MSQPVAAVSRRVRTTFAAIPRASTTLGHWSSPCEITCPSLVYPPRRLPRLLGTLSPHGSRDFSTGATNQFTSTPRRARSESLAPDTHYAFFPDTLPHGPPPKGRFHVDLRQLRNEFLQLQASAHPDRHPGATKARAEALSSRINEAYKTLKEPLSRAQYILALKGVDVEDEAGKVEDMELLALVMEAREEIEDATSEAELQGLRVENETRLKESVERLGGLLEKGKWDDGRAEAVRLRYWVNVKESIEAWKPGEGVPNLIH